MVVLDIVAPNLLLLGLAYGNAQNTALLNNFEIVATSLIVSLIVGVSFRPFEYIIYGLLIGFVSYGLSILSI